MDDEIPLTGGNVAAGVTRVGDTIRKPVTANTPATQALLTKLAAAGVNGVPQFLGIDDKNRQMLRFVSGDTDFPANLWTDDAALLSAARLLRRIHNATLSLTDATVPWAYSHPDPLQHEVICHNDFAPYNMTFDTNGAVIGVFDFDLAGPAPRIRDLAYLAWWIVPLGRQDAAMDAATQVDLDAKCRRLRLLCKTYGVPANRALLDMITEVLTHMSDPDAASRMIGDAATQTLIAGGHLDQWAQSLADFAQIKGQIAANLDV